MTVIVIPAYKPDQALTMVAAQLFSFGYQIIVVDDGSGTEYQPITVSSSDRLKIRGWYLC